MTPMEELREQAAKVAEDIAKGCAGAFSVASADQKWRTAAWSGAAAHIAAAIRNIPLPAPVALPQAGEVAAYPGLPMSDADLAKHYEASKHDVVGLVGSEVRQIIGELRYLRARPTPTETPTAAAPDDGQLRSALPKQIGRLHLGEKVSDGNRLCSWDHNVPAEHPLYWPQMASQFDDSDPCCLAHAIEQSEGEQSCPAPDDGLMGRYREAAQHMVDAWESGDQDDLEAAECNLRCALKGKPLTYQTIAEAKALSTATGDEGGK